jgi:hypothetical protein
VKTRSLIAHGRTHDHHTTEVVLFSQGTGTTTGHHRLYPQCQGLFEVSRGERCTDTGVHDKDVPTFDAESINGIATDFTAQCVHLFELSGLEKSSEKIIKEAENGNRTYRQWAVEERRFDDTRFVEILFKEWDVVLGFHNSL